ncbi:MAG TPA: Rrf2 family transcriptional regulator [Gemmatimonadaceae bacterium]|nr:Rrf2 family transcriptional regulator [Gemmatimonadaceae bacterium]
MRNSSSAGSHPLLTKTADYALRALLVLARQGSGRPMPAETIAELTGTPANYLSKTLYALGKAGLLRGTRGPAGGFALAVAPETITLAAVADVFAEPAGTPRCLLGTGPCDAAAPCAAHHRWTRVARAAREPLHTTTVADLLSEDAGAVATPDFDLPSHALPGVPAGAF